MNILEKVILSAFLTVLAVLFWVVPDPLPLVDEIVATLAAGISLLSTTKTLRAKN